MVAETQNQLYMPFGLLINTYCNIHNTYICIVIRKLPPRDASQVLYVY